MTDNKEETVLISIAEKIAANVNAKDEKFAIDPFTIIAIINIIIAITKIIMEYRKNREVAKATIRKPGFFARVLLKREINKHFKSAESRNVYDAILSVSSSLSEKELDDSLNLIEKELNT